MFKLDLLENERTIALYRQSEAVLIKTVFAIFLLIYFPWYFLLKYDLAGTYVRLLLFWTVLVFIYAINKYILWLINCYIITNQRLVIVNYKSLFNKTVLETRISGILNVSFSSKGITSAMFSFGDVKVQAEGLTEPMILKNVSKPSQVKDFILNLRAKTTQKNIPYAQ